jgi:glycosyltransferase involved in cell wall biosynthesis
MEAPFLSVVVPVYNESASLEPLARRIADVCKAEGYRVEIIFVDDGSSDATAGVLANLAKSDNAIKFIVLKRNFGQTAALAAGLDHAAGDFIITMDGDLQNDPADIPKLLDKCREGFDLVNGWRRRRKDPFLTKIVPSFFANWIIRKITGVQIHDTGCTLKIFRKGVLNDLHLYGEMHRFIPALLHWSGAKIGEIEVSHTRRVHGRSKYSLAKLPRVVLDLLNIKFLISYSTRPIQIFGKIGFITFLFSFLSLAVLIAMKLYWHTDMTGNPFLLLTVFLGFIGIQFIIMGLLGEINIRIYHESTRKKIYQIARKSFG